MIPQKVYLFNPTHDLALANGEMNYIPPASARRMEEDLALLPIWYVSANDAVLVPSFCNFDFFSDWQKNFDIPITLLTEDSLKTEIERIIVPWGWNPALRRHLLILGVNEACVPTMEYIYALRNYSYRLWAVRLLPKLLLNNYFCGESVYLETPSLWQEYVEKKGTCLLKAPLSGSGKGLNWCKGGLTSSIAGRCAHIATLQGGVVGEPIYNKVQDFAMEFYVVDGKFIFVGYSLFRTDEKGRYAGNELLSNEEILQLLAIYVPYEELVHLRFRLIDELASWLGNTYVGYLGVDMMICYFPGEIPEYRIHPCVEINLRMNMGIVARLLTDRYISSKSKGVLRILRYPSPGQALEVHRRWEEEFPLQLEDGRICVGYYSLVPVTVFSTYHAFIYVERKG